MKIFFTLMFYLFLYPISLILKLFGKVYVSNQYKTKNSYWFKTYKKTSNIPDTNYTLW